MVIDTSAALGPNTVEHVLPPDRHGPPPVTVAVGGLAPYPATSRDRAELVDAPLTRPSESGTRAAVAPRFPARPHTAPVRHGARNPNRGRPEIPGTPTYRRRSYLRNDSGDRTIRDSRCASRRAWGSQG